MTEPMKPPPEREEPLDATVNPYQPPATAGTPQGPKSDLTSYHLVTDTVTGVNFRIKDNVVQALTIFFCLVLGAIIGALVAGEAVPGILVGGFIGVVVGLFGSGIFLMVYRAVMHMRGRHD